MPNAMPLANKRIVVTRARHQAAPLEALIREYGGIPLAFPCIAIEPLTATCALDSHLRNLGDFHWLALSSSNAANAVAERARAISLQHTLAAAKIAALGPATAAELRRQLSRAPDFTPTSFSAESLARQLPIQPGDRVLLPQSDLADDKTARIMELRGAAVTALPAYRTLVGRGGVDLQPLIDQGKVDALTFASPSAVRNFRQRCPVAAALPLPALCLGPATAQAAGDHHFQLVLTPPIISLRAMLTELSGFFASR